MIVKYECKCCKAQFEDEEKGKEHELLCFEKRGLAKTIAFQMNELVKLARKNNIYIDTVHGHWYGRGIKEVMYKFPSELGMQEQCIVLTYEDE